MTDDGSLSGDDGHDHSSVIAASWSIDQIRRRWGPIAVSELTGPPIIAPVIRFFGSTDALATDEAANLAPGSNGSFAVGPFSALEAVDRSLVAAETTTTNRLSLIGLGTCQPDPDLLVAAVSTPVGSSWREFDVRADEPIDTASRVLRWVVDAAEGRPTD